jgi:hypothetical protein
MVGREKKASGGRSTMGLKDVMGDHPSMYPESRAGFTPPLFQYYTPFFRDFGKIVTLCDTPVFLW